MSCIYCTNSYFKKRARRDHLSTVATGFVHAVKGSLKHKNLKRARILFDTGCGATLINHTLVEKLTKKSCGKTTWNTKAGSFQTKEKVICSFTLPEFHENRDIKWPMFVDESDPKTCNYDMITGRDLLEKLGMDFHFSTGLMTWDLAEVPMKNPSCFNEDVIDQTTMEALFMHDPDTTEVERIQQTLDAEYSPANLSLIHI